MASKKIQIVGLDIPQSDWNQTDEIQLDYIKNKPTILTEADIMDILENNKEELAAIIIESMEKAEGWML